MKKFILVHHLARRRACEAIHEAPTGWEVSVKPPTRSLSANAALHAWIGEIASQKEWAGSKRDAETWKRLLVASWLRTRGESIEILPALDGHGVDFVFRRTSTLTKAECSELLEYVTCWAVENGVTNEARELEHA